MKTYAKTKYMLLFLGGSIFDFKFTCKCLISWLVFRLFKIKTLNKTVIIFDFKGIIPCFKIGFFQKFKCLFPILIIIIR